MKVLRFDLCGKMAHFRKYYSNSTALSYYVPPVTTVKGILAGLLGWERDSYYDCLSKERCGIAVGTGGKIRKMTQTMNLLKVENPNQLNGSWRPTKQIYGANHTQNDTEWIIPENLRTDALRYSICMCHQDETILDKLADRLCGLPCGYRSSGISLALGSAQCQGWIERAVISEAEEQQGERVTTRFALPVTAVSGLDRQQDGPGTLSLLKEETITEFDARRMITARSKENILLSDNGLPASFRLKPGASFWQDGQDAWIFL